MTAEMDACRSLKLAALVARNGPPDHFVRLAANRPSRSPKLAALVARNGPLDHFVRLAANRSSQ
jgi:hypothetical protein